MERTEEIAIDTLGMDAARVINEISPEYVIFKVEREPTDSCVAG